MDLRCSLAGRAIVRILKPQAVAETYIPTPNKQQAENMTVPSITKCGMETDSVKNQERGEPRRKVNVHSAHNPRLILERPIGYPYVRSNWYPGCFYELFAQGKKKRLSRWRTNTVRTCSQEDSGAPPALFQ